MLAHHGAYGKSVKALDYNGLFQINDHVRDCLKAKHSQTIPRTHGDHDDALPQHVLGEPPLVSLFDADEMRSTIKSFATGPGGGGSGLTLGHLLKLTSCEKACDDGGLLHALAALATKWA